MPSFAEGGGWLLSCWPLAFGFWLTETSQARLIILKTIILKTEIAIQRLYALQAPAFCKKPIAKSQEGAGRYFIFLGTGS
jgi:hypothetical protein